jgi:SAM-dependent methyltransferase
MKNSVNDLLVAPWKTCVVFTAIRLNIFTILSKEMMSAEEVASNCEAAPYLLKALLDACVSMGLLIFKDDKYINSDFSKTYLVEEAPQYVGDLIKLQYDESSQWDKLYDIIMGSKPASVGETNTGGEHRTEEQKYRTLIKGMNNLGMLGEAEALKNAVDLSGCKKMIDAGGGSGLYSAFLCRQYPELESTILDQKASLMVAEEMLAGANERNRIELREADLTKDPFGKDIDVVLISDVIYDESEAEPVLRNAWDCLRREGILILRGYYSDPEKPERLFGAIFVLNMLIFDPMRKIMTISSLRQKVGDIGFTIITVSPLTELSWILIAKK